MIRIELGDEMEEVVHEYIKCCTDDELIEIAPCVIKEMPSDSLECEEFNKNRTPQYQIAYDVMNDEPCAQSTRKYIAQKFIDNPESIGRVFRQCWERLFNTLESQGYRPMPFGLIHEDDINDWKNNRKPFETITQYLKRI